MKARTVLLMVVCVAFVCLIDSPSAQRRGIPIQVDYERPPRTWEEAAARSQVVAVVRLTGRRYASESWGPTTVYKADVLEVVRNAGPYQVPSVIEIPRIGGMIERPEGLVSVEEAGFPPWFVGTKLLLFLNWNKEATMLAMSGGPNLAFEVDAEGRARTFGKSALAARQNRRPFSEFLSEIKKKVR
jgi:hypothetical protein